MIARTCRIMDSSESQLDSSQSELYEKIFCYAAMDKFKLLIDRKTLSGILK